MSEINLEKKIEALLLYKNEPTSRREMAKLLKVEEKEVNSAIQNLKDTYKERGIVIIDTGEEVAFGTNPDASFVIEEIRKEELSKDLGRAGLETLAIVLYKSPVPRREIDFIRGVNSSFILRNLQIKGLIERTEGEARGYTYKPTLELLRYLGIKELSDLPEYGIALRKMQEFVKTAEENKEDADE